MTLVVARQISNEVYLLADTKITPTIASAISSYISFNGGLKLVILAPWLCVGFANNTEYARKAIEGIYSKDINIFDNKQIINYFLNIHLASIEAGDSADFIVALINECKGIDGTSTKEVFKIADSKVSSENISTYIGDNAAFNCFQDISHNGRTDPYSPNFEISKLGKKERPEFDKSLCTAMIAMQGVIDNIDILVVDGIRTTVVSEENQFRYVEDHQIRGRPIPVRNELNAPVSFGAAAEGSAHKQVGMFSAAGCGVFPGRTGRKARGCRAVHPVKSGAG